MSFINSTFSLQDAVNFGFDTWDLYISNWGNTISGLANTVVFPAPGQKGMPTIAGVAIGPQSEVDRCFVAYDLQKEIPEQISWDRLRRLSVEAPLMYPQQGTQVKVDDGNPSTGNSTLVIYPRGGDDYLSDSSNGYMPWTTFGQTYNAINGSNQQLSYSLNATTVRRPSALLHLVVYLKPPLHGAPTKRVPWRRRFQYSALTSTADMRMIVAPAFGRKRLQLECLMGQQFTWRITSVAIDSNGLLTEVPLAVSSAPVAADTRFVYQNSQLMNADFVVFYVTANSLVDVFSGAAILSLDDG